MIRSIPALPVRNMMDAVECYTRRFGFLVHHLEAGFCILLRDAVELHLWESADESWKERLQTHPEQPVSSGAESFIAGTSSCRIEVSGIDALFALYKESEVLYNAATEVRSMPWGAREFPTLDNCGNLLTFFERER